MCLRLKFDEKEGEAKHRAILAEEKGIAAKGMRIAAKVVQSCIAAGRQRRSWRYIPRDVAIADALVIGVFRLLGFAKTSESDMKLK